MKITKAQQTLLSDAQKAGYNVEVLPKCIDIYKVTKAGLMIKGIRIYENKTAYRLDVELTATTTIRTIKMMRSILGV